MRTIAEEHGVSDAHPLRLRDGALRLGSAGPPLARAAAPTGELTCDVLVSAIGATAEPDEPDIPGLDGLHRTPLSLGSLGLGSRSARRARSGHRDRSGGRPVHPADRAPGRSADRLPAHAAVGDPAFRPTGSRDRAPALPAPAPSPGRAAQPVLRPVRGMRDRLSRADRADRADRVAGARPPAPAGPRSRVACQARARGTGSAASDRSCRTPTTRRSPARTSSW